jgi:hypothetical protein
MIQSKEGTMRIAKQTLIIIWAVLAVILVPPAIMVTIAMGQAADRYIETGLLPFNDPPAERRATEWLQGQGKRNVVIRFEIDPDWSACPRRTRCYSYAATDGQGRFEDGIVFTKPSDLTVAQN